LEILCEEDFYNYKKQKTIEKKLRNYPATTPGLSRKTQNNRQKGLLDCRVAVCCALKNNGPFFELDPPNSEEPASLKDTRMKKIHQEIINMKIAGEN